MAINVNRCSCHSITTILLITHFMHYTYVRQAVYRISIHKLYIHKCLGNFSLSPLWQDLAERLAVHPSLHSIFYWLYERHMYIRLFMMMLHIDGHNSLSHGIRVRAVVCHCVCGCVRVRVVAVLCVIYTLLECLSKWSHH